MDKYKKVIEELIKFRNERDWEQFHDSKNLALAISIEAAELNELFLWKKGNDVENVKIDKIKEELGDLLFAVVNVARFLKIRPELALNDTINKFIRRFKYIEESANEKGVDLNDMTLEEMDNFWNKAKKIEKMT